jgi:DNA polymerase V
MPLKDIWGIGRQLAPKLRAEGLSTALHVAKLNPKHAQQLMGIHGRQLVSELNGISCHQLERKGAVAKSIMRSRTFGEDTNQMHVLESAIASLSAPAAHRLRTEHLLAKRVGFFTMTNRHKPGYRRWVREVKLDMPTSDTGHIIELLVRELDDIFSSSQAYHRLGVFLYDFVREDALQTDLFGLVNPD